MLIYLLSLSFSGLILMTTLTLSFWAWFNTTSDYFRLFLALLLKFPPSNAELESLTCSVKACFRTRAEPMLFCPCLSAIGLRGGSFWCSAAAWAWGVWDWKLWLAWALLSPFWISDLDKGRVGVAPIDAGGYWAAYLLPSWEGDLSDLNCVGF